MLQNSFGYDIYHKGTMSDTNLQDFYPYFFLYSSVYQLYHIRTAARLASLHGYHLSSS
jgi:hypothetical protein